MGATLFFPQQTWWNTSTWDVPDTLKYACERWWELLRDWRSITVYSIPPSYVLSLLEDFADVLDDLQDGRLRTSHQVDCLKDEVEERLKADQLLQNAFPSEIASVLSRITSLYDQLPPDPQQKYAELKKRSNLCRYTASSARRLHHRCLKRRKYEPDMTWVGLGGLLGSELISEIESTSPSFTKLDRLLTSFLIDSLYRGYNLDYLKTLFDRYIPQSGSARDGLLHAFRRLHSMLRHEYEILFVLNGADSVLLDVNDLEICTYSDSELSRFSIQNEVLDDFLRQRTSQSSVVLGIHWTEAPDAGAAAESARKKLQEVVDFLDFQTPVQEFEIGDYAIVTWKDREGRPFSRVHPDEKDEQPAIRGHSAELDSTSTPQLTELAEALRWSSVARRESSPEVSLLASWFAFEFLAGNLDRTPVEGIMEFFPKVLAIGNLRRRLIYWWRSLSSHPEFEASDKREQLKRKALFHGGGLNLGAAMELLVESASSPRSDEAQAVHNIASSSVLLRERTVTEAKLFGNPQLIAQTLTEDRIQIQRELQGFLVIRNKLVHRARIDHPLLPVTARRAEARLYDLLRDISGQLGGQRIENTIVEVFKDFRDTYDELLVDLGQNKVVGTALIQRITLS